MLHQNGGGTSDYGEKPEPHQSYQNLFPVHESPQHSRVHRQISQIIGGAGDTSKSHMDLRDIRAPISPPIDDMAPQSISFIGDEDVLDRSAPLTHHMQPLSQQQFHRPNIGSVSQQHLQNNNHSHKHEQELDLGKLNITSGKLTYRIPSPTRPSLNLNSFQVRSFCVLV